MCRISLQYFDNWDSLPGEKAYKREIFLCFLVCDSFHRQSVQRLSRKREPYACFSLSRLLKFDFLEDKEHCSSHFGT
jgi:hypothetical protein